MACVDIGELYTSAAEGATAAMKGRLASKYFALAEEAWAQVEWLLYRRLLPNECICRNINLW